MKRALLVLALNISLPTYAKDLGEHGPVYSIIEESLLEVIYQKLITFKNNGTLVKMQTDFQKQVERNTERPHGSNLKKAVINKERLLDPSLTLPKTIKNHKGQIIARQGTTINPLDYLGLTKELVFINGDRLDELDYAAKKLNENYDNKIILVQGNIKEVNKYLNAPVFFDQNARLVQRFEIQATPTVISQFDKLLKITEVAL